MDAQAFELTSLPWVRKENAFKWWTNLPPGLAIKRHHTYDSGLE